MEVRGWGCWRCWPSSDARTGRKAGIAVRYDPPPPVGPAADGHAEKVAHGLCHPEDRNRSEPQLQVGRRAVVNALTYLSFALRRIDAGMTEDEYRVQTYTWDLPDDDPGTISEEPWNPDTVWLTALEIHAGTVRIRGEAKAHLDAATFTHRLGTGGHFPGIRLVRSVTSESMHQSYVEFELEGRFFEDR